MTTYTRWEDIGLAIAECCKTLLCECCCGTPGCWTYTSDTLSSYTLIKNLWPMGNIADSTVAGSYPEDTNRAWVRWAQYSPDFAAGGARGTPAYNVPDSESHWPPQEGKATVWMIEDTDPVSSLGDAKEKDWGLKLIPRAAPNTDIVDCTMVWHNTALPRHSARGVIISPNGRFFKAGGLDPVDYMTTMPPFTAKLVYVGLDTNANPVPDTGSTAGWPIYKLCSAPASVGWNPDTWGASGSFT